MKIKKTILSTLISLSLSANVLASTNLNEDYQNQQSVINSLNIDNDYEPNGLNFKADADSRESDCLYHFPLDGIAQTSSKKIAENTIMLCYGNFVSFVSSETKAPLIVAEQVTKTQLIESYNHRDKVKVRFHRETRLPQKAQAFDEMYQQTVYENSPYKMATLASPYFQISFLDQDSTFSFANVLPVNADLRKGLWTAIEKGLRLFIYETANTGYLISGAYYDPKKTIYRLGGVDGVAVPTNVFKAFYFPSQGISSAYWLANENSGRYEVISITELKKRIGIDVFPNVADSIKQKAVYPPKPFYGEENYLTVKDFTN